MAGTQAPSEDSTAEPVFQVIAPAGIRDSVGVPMPGETEEERQRRDDLFHAIRDAAGYEA